MEDIRSELKKQNIVVDNFARKLDIVPMTIRRLIWGNSSLDNIKIEYYQKIVNELFGKQKFYNMNDIKSKAREKKLKPIDIEKEIDVSRVTLYKLFGGRDKLETKKLKTYKEIVNFLWR